jgi:hypothetical protein
MSSGDEIRDMSNEKSTERELLGFYIQISLRIFAAFL